MRGTVIMGNAERRFAPCRLIVEDGSDGYTSAKPGSSVGGIGGNNDTVIHLTFCHRRIAATPAPSSISVWYPKQGAIPSSTSPYLTFPLLTPFSACDVHSSSSIGSSSAPVSTLPEHLYKGTVYTSKSICSPTVHIFTTTYAELCK